MLTAQGKATPSAVSGVPPVPLTGSNLGLKLVGWDCRCPPVRAVRREPPAMKTGRCLFISRNVATREVS